MNTADEPEAPSVPADATLWLRPRMVVGLGVVLAAAAIGVTTAFLWHERGDVIGKRTGEGALTGALAGVLFGPPGLAVGLVAGASAGGLSEAGRAPHLHDAFLDELRSEVPQKSSALLLLAAPEHVDAMVAAVEGHGGRLVRHHLSSEAALALEQGVAGRPRVTPAGG